MLNHLTTYTLILVRKRVFNEPDHTIAASLEALYCVPVYPKAVEQILTAKKPKTNYLVHELHDLGFQNGHISRILGIGKGVVSYHFRQGDSRDSDRPWYSSVIATYDNDYSRSLRKLRGLP